MHGRSRWVPAHLATKFADPEWVRARTEPAGLDHAWDRHKVGGWHVPEVKTEAELIAIAASIGRTSDDFHQALDGKSHEKFVTWQPTDNLERARRGQR